VHHQAIVRIEIGRTPLKYGDARKLLWALTCNPVWLATGKGAQKLSIILPEAAGFGVREDACFSDVFEQHIAPLFEAPKSADTLEDSSPELRFASAAMLREFIDEWLCEVPDGRVQDLTGGIQAYVLNLLDKWPKDSAKQTLLRRIWFKRLAGIRQRVEYPDRDKSMLDENSPNSKSGDVTDLDKLIERVRNLASQHGAKTELAKFLGVAPARITEWLAEKKSDRKEPGGHYTLQLLKWVERQERKK